MHFWHYGSYDVLFGTIQKWGNVSTLLYIFIITSNFLIHFQVGSMINPNAPLVRPLTCKMFGMLLASTWGLDELFWNGNEQWWRSQSFWLFSICIRREATISDCSHFLQTRYGVSANNVELTLTLIKACFAVILCWS